MNVLLVSQCDKRALTETRRILDQFAERRGERTWQTPITQDGLDTLRRLLRKTARKNTAVACHWIRGMDHSEMLWVVGDASRFNAEGAVPTNTTARNVLRARDENDWQTGEDIHLLGTLAALLHDLGKATAAFQQRLQGHGPLTRNLYRHEWVSVRLFQAFVGRDDDAVWLARLAAPDARDDASWFDRLQCDGMGAPCDKPFAVLPPLAQAVAWLVLTHHRLPVKPRPDGTRLGRKLAPLNPDDLTDLLAQVDASWNEQCTETAREHISPYWQFPHGLPVTTTAWRERAARVARRLAALRQQPGKGDWLANPYVMHVSRLALMLADHHYSSLTDPKDTRRVRGERGYPLAANTRFDSEGRRVVNQTLDEHLVGVARHCAELCHALPRFEQHLPRLARHKGLKRRSDDARFRWQDKAADLAAGMRTAAAAGGAFIVNMASTGCGKTLANARVMYALADPQQGMRCSFALGLRTLTLQTGRVYRDDVRLGDEVVAIRVGGAPSRELFEHQLAQAEATGSASSQALLGEAGDHDDGGVFFEGNTDGHPLLAKAMHDPAVRKLLAAPVLVCTIDHLTPATESQRGGRQIAPMLRLMSSDLVLDELDDFDIADLPAVARLVHWAGLLGARVMISSATLPPALVQGMFEAYRDGRSLYARNRGLRPGEAAPIACAWVDEFDQQRHDSDEAAGFAQAHLGFVRQRHAHLAKGLVRRRVELLPFTHAGRAADLPTHAAQCIREAVATLHQRHHGHDPVTGKRVSFGLVRMANIAPLVEVALALYRLGAPAGMRLHLCVYHSRFPLLLRSAIERVLDQALDRREDGAVFRLPEVRARLVAHDEDDQVFVVLGSPVTEVGRDHDYDWAVVEPSSMRSLIQLAGRVWRHRPLRECTAPNVIVLDHNLRFWSQPDQPAFMRPGFETTSQRLPRKPLGELLRPGEREVIDARPRILPQPALRPDASLVDLEHARLQATLQPAPPVAVASPSPGRRSNSRVEATAQHELFAHHWWTLARHDALLAAVLQQQQPFRQDDGREVDACLLPDEDGEDFALHLVQDKPGVKRETLYVEYDSKLERVPGAAVAGERIAPWNAPDYLQTLADLAAALDMPLLLCAQRYGQVTLPDHDRGWRFHPALGFTKRR
ncbi:type I-F CRISPR-associated helicase Cas3f [Xenophilus sp. Marseille-Q4582]|uniref:type I-F CRISPR-associated helicase Cas3f n=1 Tax=Xenophilus sp. Marseille-Q4582 TaxID=2866600 RepID=UPI001CE3DCF7|nr:type I-F CRISPR-associated helicase Cas3f [Xenophilus sp. Marseille-Q4582]